MGFSVKLAPGVRVRASSRGLRTSVGPRAARMHVGGGRTGFSTGVGPVGYYTSVGGRSRSSRGAGRRTSTASATRSLTAAAKAEQAQELAAALKQIADLHRQEFTAAQPPRAPAVPVPKLEELVGKHRKEELAGIGLFQWSKRKEAKQHAAAAAQAEHDALAQTAQAEQQADQQRLDRAWRDLLDNDPATVLAALAAAYEDNEASAAPLGVQDGTASVVVLVPSPEAVPGKMPGTTAAGNLSLRQMTKRQASDFYKMMVCGYLLATVKEAFAVAPGLTEVAIVAVRHTAADAYGKRHPEAVMAARFTRDALQGIRWADADSTQVVNDASHELVATQKGAAQQLQPLAATEHPEIAAALKTIELATESNKPF